MNENSNIFNEIDGEKQPLLANEPTTYNGETAGEKNINIYMSR